MERPIASKNVSYNTNVLNCAIPNFPPTIPNNPTIETSFLMSNLFSKLKEFEGVFDSFLKGCDSAALNPNSSLKSSTNKFDPKFRNIDLKHPLLKSNFITPFALKFSSRDKLKNDVFLTDVCPNKDLHHNLFVMNALSSKNIGLHHDSSLNTSTDCYESSHLFFDNPELFEEIPTSFELTSESYHDEAQSPIFFLFNEDIEKDEDTASQCTVFDDRQEYWNIPKNIDKTDNSAPLTSIPTNSSSNSIQKDYDFMSIPSDDCHKINDLSQCLHSDDSSGYSTPCFLSQPDSIKEIESEPIALNELTVFEKLTELGVDWCRYCGTTEGINWRPGPWGKRTLCNKHGCDYKGYGFASKTPRLDLRSFIDEPIENRKRPILQSYCYVCLFDSSSDSNPLILCNGCPYSYHLSCLETTDLHFDQDKSFYCNESCQESLKRRKIVVELQKKKLPFMCSPNPLPPKPTNFENNNFGSFNSDPVNKISFNNTLTLSKKRQISHLTNDSPKKRKSSRTHKLQRDYFFEDSFTSNY
ncbi:hypothetical protein AYI69_g5054 [Smittium culicis]|uniref:Zinc finger PHD-type domain-containing protein n=1 Tax=Smittium culicis TaxID=133412 RepID=A0A1R1Y8T2_9FUNG|nr:hypothetical protein AYI69_g5054 [Smittium culicis]